MVVPVWLTGHLGPEVVSQLEDGAVCLAELLTKLLGFTPANPTYQTPAASLESCLIPAADLLQEYQRVCVSSIYFSGQATIPVETRPLGVWQSTLEGTGRIDPSVTTTEQEMIAIVPSRFGSRQIGQA